ncbi:hypothetical protein D3C80_1684550 [compost metagenome]
MKGSSLGVRYHLQPGLALRRLADKELNCLVNQPLGRHLYQRPYDGFKHQLAEIRERVTDGFRAVENRHEGVS